MTNELALSAENLREESGGTWSEYSAFPVADWQYEVANGDTRLGYWDWCVCQIEQSDDNCASQKNPRVELEPCVGGEMKRSQMQKRLVTLLQQE